MKEEKKKSILSLTVPISSQNAPLQNFRRESYHICNKSSQKSIEQHPKNEENGTTKLIGSKNTMESFYIEVKGSIRSQNVSVNDQRQNASFLSSKIEKENLSIPKQYKRKLKRVGKKMWVAAYKENVERENSDEVNGQREIRDLTIRASTNFLSPETVLGSDDFSDFKQYSRGSFNSCNVSEMSRIIEPQQQFNEDVPVITINGEISKSIKQILISLTENEQTTVQPQVEFGQGKGKQEMVNEQGMMQVWMQRECQQKIQCSSSSSIAIEDGIIKDINEQIDQNGIQVKAQQSLQYQTDEIQKMLQEIEVSQANKSTIKANKNKQTISKQPENAHNHLPQQQERLSRNLSQKQESVESKTPTSQSKIRYPKQPKPLLQKKLLEPRNSSSSLLKKFINKETIKKNTPLPSPIPPSNTFKRQSMSEHISIGFTNEKKPLSIHKKSVLNEICRQNDDPNKLIQNHKLPNLKIQKQSSIASLNSSISMNASVSQSKVIFNQIKLKESLKNKQLNKNTQIIPQPNLNKFRPPTPILPSPSLHSSATVKKTGKNQKIALQKGNKMYRGQQQNRITNSLKKNYKSFEVNQYINQARRQLKIGD